MNEILEITKRWIAKAESDIKVAQHEIEHEAVKGRYREKSERY